MRGKFIVFEGIDGCGKTLQTWVLTQQLWRWFGVTVLETKEPGGSPTRWATGMVTVGSHFRYMLLSSFGGTLTPLSRALLFAADRAQHVNDVIKPALADGVTVICDRYRLSNFVYQQVDGVDLDTLRQIDNIACDGVIPDLYILLDIPVDVALSRAKGRNYFEERGLDYHERVRQAYLDLAEVEPNVIVIDGNLPANVVAQDVWDNVKGLMGWSPEKIEVKHGC